MYEARTLTEIQPLLERYAVRYVIVGELERRSYPPAGLEKFSALNPVFRSNTTSIYELGNGEGSRHGG